MCRDWVKLGETSLKTFISQYVLVFGIVSFAVAQIIYIVSFGFEQRQVSNISIQAMSHKTLFVSNRRENRGFLDDGRLFEFWWTIVQPCEDCCM